LYAKSQRRRVFRRDQAATLDLIRNDLGQVDLVVYSLASPRRTHSQTGIVHKSCLKPVGTSYTNKTVDTDKGIVSTVTIEPANEAEIADTIAVMGGEDWEMWMNSLSDAKLLAPGAQSVAYSYIGPGSHWAIYKNGTIGPRQKTTSSAPRKNIDSLLKAERRRPALSGDKELVTQASSAISGRGPLHFNLHKLMKRGTHEGLHRAVQRLFATQCTTQDAEIRRGGPRPRR